MKPNPGHLPAEAIGKRVRVQLVREREPAPGRVWAADGKGGCRWTRTGSDFDIARYEVL